MDERTWKRLCFSFRSSAQLALAVVRTRSLLFLFFFLTMDQTYQRREFALLEGTDLQASLKLDAATKVVVGDVMTTADAIIRLSRAKEEKVLAKMPASKFAKSLTRFVEEPKNLQGTEILMVKDMSFEFRYPRNYDPKYFNDANDVCTLDDPKSLLGRIVWGCVSKTMIFRPDLLRGVIYSLAWTEYGIEQLDEGTFSVMNDIAIDSVVEWNRNANWNNED